MCAIADGRTACWGAGHAGQLGTKKWDQALAPVATAAVSDGYPARGVSALSAGGASTCAISRQRLYCWGDGRVLGREMPPTAPPRAPSSEPCAWPRSNGSTSAMITAVRWLRVWSGAGGERLRTAGSGRHDQPVSSRPGALDGRLLELTSVAGVRRYRAHLRPARRCGVVLGDNSEGQLGDGSTDNSPVPVRVGGALTGQTIVGITAGATHTCARTSSLAWCWGGNAFGELGRDGRGRSLEPVSVLGPDGLGPLTKISALRAGREATCAVSVAVALCWGTNAHGELGDGTVQRRSLPVIVSGGC